MRRAGVESLGYTGLLVFLAHPGAVAPTDNGSERLLRPAVVRRKVTNGYRATWAASGEADIRTVVDPRATPVPARSAPSSGLVGA